MRSARAHAVYGLAFFVAAAAAAPIARATVAVEVPLEDLAREADAIVHGVVTRVGTRMVARGGSLDPNTVVRIRVHEWIKGSGGRRVRLVELGGVGRDVGLAISGSPQYRPGEEVIVFIALHAGVAHTLDLAQGRFVVRRNVPDGQVVVTRDLRGIGFARFDAKGITIDATPRRTSLPLAELRRVIDLACQYGGNPGAHLDEAPP
jgi:hypothetical protein